MNPHRINSWKVPCRAICEGFLFVSIEKLLYLERIFVPYLLLNLNLFPTMARSTYDVNFYCSPSKASKKTGEAPIYISIIVNGKRELFPLPMKCKPADFKKSMDSKKSNPIKDYCNTITTKLDEYKLDMARNGEGLTAKSLREFFENGGGKRVYKLDDLFTEYLSILYNRIGVNLKREIYVKYQRAIDYFKTANNLSGEESLNTITRQHILDFQTKSLSDFKASTSAGYQAKIRTIFKYAFESGKINTYLYNGIHIDRGIDESNIKFLTEDELKKIKEKKFSTKRMDNIRDCFLFQCYTGLSYIDMKQLEVDDFKRTDDGRYYISKKRQKTNQNFTTVLLKDAADIAIRNHFDLKVKSNQKYNEYLKELADLCGIEKCLTTHMARHTFIVYCLNKHIPQNTIGKMCGWAEGDAPRMLRVYGKLLDETVFADTAHLETEEDRFSREVMEILFEGESVQN